MTYCAIDFGTSNSAVALPDGLKIRLAPVEGDAVTLPTAVFFNTDENNQSYGRAALEAYIDGFDGRLMRSMKSIRGPEHGSRRRLGHQVHGRHHAVPSASEAEGAGAFRRTAHARRARPPGLFRR
jgi:molecular chaperone DnaK (HSP70)